MVFKMADSYIDSLIYIQNQKRKFESLTKQKLLELEHFCEEHDISYEDCLDTINRRINNHE